MRSAAQALLGTLLRGGYTVLTSLLAALSIPIWFARDLRHGGGVGERYGAVPARTRDSTDVAGCLWFHAASVGEAGVLARVVAPLADLTPDLPVVVTTMTSTGRDRARQLLGERAHIQYVPLDAPWLVRRTVRRLHPQVLVLAETELWPNLLRTVQRYGAPVVLVNGRLSDRSFRRYRPLRAGFLPTVSRLSAACVKTPEDADRFARLGMPPDRIVVAGDLKYEVLPGVARAGAAERRERVSLPAGRPLLVAGSTHGGEEEAVLAAFRQVLARSEDALLVVAPRYPNRCDEVAALIQGSGMSMVRRSGQRATEDLRQAQVLLVDTIGELEGIHASADASFVGGSLVQVGGHNLLEPAGYGVPVFFGPNTGETGGADRLLLSSGGGGRIDDSAALASAWISLLEDPASRERMGRAARDAVSSRRGALARVVEVYARALGIRPPPLADGARRDGGSRGPRSEEIPAFPEEGAR